MKNTYVDNLDGSTALIIHSKSLGDVRFLVDTEDVARLRVFHWIVKPCGSDIVYAHATIGNEGTGFKSTISLHRYAMSFGSPMYDHINGNSKDNRKANLRSCTSSENRRNSRKPVTGSAKYRGVYKRKESDWYRAQIRFEGKIIDIGQYKSQEEGARAYDQYAKKVYGNFAKLNFPDRISN